MDRVLKIKSKGKLYLLLSLGIIVAIAYGNQKKLQYYLYYNTQIPEVLAKLRGEYPVNDEHVLTSIGGKLALRGKLPTMPILVNKYDTGVSKQIRAVGSWEGRLGFLLLNVVKPNDTVVEVGANYGYYSLLMGRAAGDNGKVLTFEANPHVAKYLDMSISLNNLENIVKNQQIAIGTQNSGNVYIVYDKNIMGNAFIVDDLNDIPKNDGKDWRYEEVKLTNLTNAIPEVKNIDVLRMDAEGSEILVINGARDLINSSPNLKIVMEWSNEIMGKYGDTNDLIDYLVSQNFRFWDISPNGLIEYSVSNLKAKKGFHDMYISRTEPGDISLSSYPKELG